MRIEHKNLTVAIPHSLKAFDVHMCETLACTSIICKILIQDKFLWSLYHEKLILMRKDFSPNFIE